MSAKVPKSWVDALEISIVLNGITLKDAIMAGLRLIEANPSIASNAPEVKADYHTRLALNEEERRWVESLADRLGVSVNRLINIALWAYLKTRGYIF